MAWIFHFTHNARNPNEKRAGVLTAEEINMAESFSGENANKIRHLGVYYGEDGLLRLKTKISNREDTESFRFPIILPAHHHVVEALILKEHNESCHTVVQEVLSRLREKYWILRGRRTMKPAGPCQVPCV
ncbi:hypothetical protein NQ315_008963 [Exocentrus adspersus]|uniref:Integrase zinc-binding domain-containing protein n=1 Tax=Exocentrus adspersus TaxID=1586481 RepID=A0AAV8VJ85_9CUCU|nr:hypothetical protein NQ315_008963 [Exocentrus adspersus]